jgi:hypothetical protein
MDVDLVIDLVRKMFAELFPEVPILKLGNCRADGVEEMV